MRLEQATDNGNVTFNSSEITGEAFNENRGWLTSNPGSEPYENRTDNSHFNSNCNNIYSSRETTETFINYSTAADIGNSKLNVELVVCNRQYRINAQSNIHCTNSIRNANNLESTNETSFVRKAVYIGESNVYSDNTPIDDDRVFDHSDTDDMSEKGVPVPRGIVNPNYPGFQHLAHTLQDYSSNIENFYHSENDMTDDDVDIEITELNYESESNRNIISTDCKNLNNNSITGIVYSPQSDSCSKPHVLDSNTPSDIPDLIKTISKNINNNEDDNLSYDLNCVDADIENNFNTKDIIGDFNKEVEDEIKHLLNYNINIQDDLEELRKDIKATFAKPIENTINNISDVVNQVIKKLVETHSEPRDDNENENHNMKCSDVDERNEINAENEKNARTEMNLSRPTFLLLDNNISNKIDDAILSDGKEEINFSQYDPDKMSQNVENTIKQLSTELRKIIPKLDEMRELDRLWDERKKETMTLTKDGNCNEIRNSFNHTLVSSVNNKIKTEVCKNYRCKDSYTVRHIPVKSPAESKAMREQQKDGAAGRNCNYYAQNKSVRKNESSNVNDVLDSFDVYNIETALPKLDIDAIENHLKAAKEAERRKRNDREEIRKRLAMGAEAEEYYSLGHTDRPSKKPSLHSRLQSGMNLQICFVNETASDNESQASDLDKNISCSTKSLSRSSLFSKNSYNSNHPYQTRPLSVNITKYDKISTVQSGAKLRPSSLSVKSSKSRLTHSLNNIELKESNFYALQATLQTEARIALAQAKELARIQMERERRARAVSPVAAMLRASTLKASAPLAPDRRRLSRQLLTDMNIAQLQVIVNELHSQIESLNERLVQLLMARDELHMGQDSMLVDIEDLTRYLGVKEQTKKTKGNPKTAMKRLTSLVTK